ncbi:hypothetical protein LA055_003728 [Escherichia coli]|nr:hypothetical protein [Escherichia coli]
MYWLIHDERSPLIGIDFTSLITAVKLYGIPPMSNATTFGLRVIETEQTIPEQKDNSTRRVKTLKNSEWI